MLGIFAYRASTFVNVNPYDGSVDSGVGRSVLDAVASSDCNSCTPRRFPVNTGFPNQSIMLRSDDNLLVSKKQGQGIYHVISLVFRLC